MFDDAGIDRDFYTQIMEEIKRLNAEKMHYSSKNLSGRRMFCKKLAEDLKKGEVHTACELVRSKTQHHLLQQKNKKILEKNQNDEKPKANYFSNERIAIYTAIVGNYDRVLEPYCKPDNCDFYIFTDSDFDDSHSTWQKLEIPSFLRDLSDAEQNRYLKMHPHEFFKDYEYSVYLDGNIQIFTDLTEYINMIGTIGLATHLHPDRDCVYAEMEHVVRRGKETRENIDRHLAYMKKTGMPHKYGLLECNIIVREHHNPLCVRIMEEWWKEYEDYAKRDQISLPHVLYKNGISIAEVGVLGSNARVNPSFRIMRHCAENKTEI